MGGNIFSGDATPEEVQDFFEVEFPETIAELTAVAPAEIADDLAISVEGFGILTTELKAYTDRLAVVWKTDLVAVNKELARLKLQPLDPNCEKVEGCTIVP